MKKRVTGVVNYSKRSKRGNKWLHEFHVRNYDDDENYGFKISKYCPVDFGDTFSCVCTCIGRNATMEGKPFIKVYDDDKSLKYHLYKLIADKGVYIKKLYPKLLNLSTNLEYDSIPQYLNRVCYEWMKKGRVSSSLTGFMEATGLNTEQVMTLMARWHSKYQMRQFKIFFSYDEDVYKIGLPLDYILEKIMSNPYTLPQITIEKCQEIDSITTRTPNEYDLHCGTILRDIYERCINRSWMCVTKKWLLYKYPSLSLSSGDSLSYEDKLVDEFDCVIDTIDDKEVVYYRDFYETEVFMAEFIIEHMNSEPKIPPINEIFYTRDDLDDTQIKAIEMCFQSNLSIETGDPGTGKTTIIKEIIHNLALNNIPYIMVSYSGKAVARMREVTGMEAYTLHKVLYKVSKFKNSMGETKFMHMIIDEASMVPLGLLKKVIEVYGREFSITLVGDANQLPPIQSGSLLNECLKSKRIPYTLLRVNHRLYRQDGDVNGILYNSQMISRWHTTDEFEFTQTDDFKIIKQKDRNGEYNLQGIVLDFQSYKKAGIDKNKFVVLTPYVVVAEAINKIGQEIFTSNSISTIDSDGREWRIGDKVIMRKNSYDINVMNGEEGEIIDVTDINITIRFNSYKTSNIEDITDGTVDISSRDKVISLSPDNGKQVVKYESEYSDDVWTGWLLLAYALTIHKSQGSEWDYVGVYIPTFKKISSFLNRNILYTAVTRAKLQVFMRGSEKLYSSIISNPLPYRCEFLAERLKLVLPQVKSNVSNAELIDPFKCESSSDDDFLWEDQQGMY